MRRTLRHRVRGWIVGTALAVVLANPVHAQSPLFGDDLFSTDDLFSSGDDLLVESDSSGQTGGLEEVFLVGDGIDAGGTFRMSLRVDRTWPDAEHLGESSGIDVDLGGTVYLDARPRRDFRAFAKARIQGGDPDAPAIALHELFADFDVTAGAWARAGKQTVNWGVGYFFSPADIVNIGRIDPQNPRAEREGPISVRLTQSIGLNTYYLYGIFGGTPGDRRVAVAPKAEWVFGRSEVGVGLFYQKDRAPRAMATLSTSIGRTSLFGEVVVSRGSDKRFVREDPAFPFGVASVEDKVSTFTHLTFGARYAYRDPDGRWDLSGAAQYYYNPEGYEGDFLRRHGPGVGLLLLSEDLAPSDLLSSGRHYLALSLGASGNGLGSVSPNLFWVANLSDGSGLVSLRVELDVHDRVRPFIGVSRTYGEAGGEYSPVGPATGLSIGVALGMGSF